MLGIGVRVGIWGRLWIVLGGRWAGLGDSGTAKDRFVGGMSLIRLSWTEWSVHEGEQVEVESEGGNQGGRRP